MRATLLLPFPFCLDAADANDDGVVNIADPLAVLWHSFGGGGDLPEPFGGCEVDTTMDGLGRQFSKESFA